MNHVFHLSKKNLDIGAVPASNPSRSRSVKLKEAFRIASVSESVSTGDMKADVEKDKGGIWRLTLETVPLRPLGRRESNVILSVGFIDGHSTTVSPPVEIEYTDDYEMDENTAVIGTAKIGHSVDFSFTLNNKLRLNYIVEAVIAENGSVLCGESNVFASSHLISLRFVPKTPGHVDAVVRLKLRNERGAVIEKTIHCFYYAIVE